LLAAAGVVAAHVAGGNLRSIGPRLSVATRARRHLALLAAAIFLVLAFGAWLRSRNCFNPSGVLFGASSEWTAARIPTYWAPVAAAPSAALAVWQSASPRFGPIAAAVGRTSWSRSRRSGYATIIQRFVVAPNEQVRESPHIQHNITATRAAFALDLVEERQRRRRRLRDDPGNAGTIRTCRSGTNSRCSTRSGRSRRSAPTTTSFRWTTTAT
jgi:uncharacterized membrane protein (UPF0182 family)